MHAPKWSVSDNKILKRSEIGCLSSDSEGLPNAVVEYMAAGLPVVATAVGGIPEVVVDGVTGALADRGDAAGLARHIADGNHKDTRLRREKVMEVSAELERGFEAAGHIRVVQLRRQLRRQQRHLDTMREPQLLLDPFFVAPYFFVEPRVFDRHRRLAREQRQELLVFLGERIELWTLEVEHAAAAILDQHRDDEL